MRRGYGFQDWTKSFWFRTILALSILAFVVGGFAAFLNAQVGGVVVSLAACGLALAAVIAGMAALRSRRSPDEQLRESP
ncbi:MAG TPA: hypothetical protein VFD92_14825 [Candidatus Binatia bacterium]|nr:hypothetical protein [Candidatus Binatia bacterium]